MNKIIVKLNKNKNEQNIIGLFCSIIGFIVTILNFINYQTKYNFQLIESLSQLSVWLVFIISCIFLFSYFVKAYILKLFHIIIGCIIIYFSYKYSTNMNYYVPIFLLTLVMTIKYELKSPVFIRVILLTIYYFILGVILVGVLAAINDILFISMFYFIIYIFYKKQVYKYLYDFMSKHKINESSVLMLNEINNTVESIQEKTKALDDEILKLEKIKIITSKELSELKTYSKLVNKTVNGLTEQTKGIASYVQEDKVNIAKLLVTNLSILEMKYKAKLNIGYNLYKEDFFIAKHYIFCFYNDMDYILNELVENNAPLNHNNNHIEVFSTVKDSKFIIEFKVVNTFDIISIKKRLLRDNLDFIVTKQRTNYIVQIRL